MSLILADDDVVDSLADVGVGSRPPLIVLDSLLAYLDRLGLGSGPVRITPLGDGHSNVTLLLEREGRNVVLRRPPRPPVAPSAHDMMREARIVSALGRTDVPVAAVLDACDDPGVIGAPFYLMEPVPGEAITDRVPAGLDTVRDGRALAHELVGALAKIHAADWRAIGLENLAPTDGYLERQLRRFLRLWEANRTRDLPEVESIAAWLADNMPTHSGTSVVHGDFRIGNAMFERGPKLTAVLDWEMATLGDPLADVGYLLAMWSERDDPPWTFDLSPVTRLPGFPGRAEVLDLYVSASGHEVPDLSFYAVLALWKLIVIMEGNAKRAEAGLSDDPFLAEFGEGVVDIARRAYRFGPGGEQLF